MQEFNKTVGVFSQSVFLPGSDRALTGTSEGCGVVWAPKQHSELATYYHTIYIYN